MSMALGTVGTGQMLRLRRNMRREKLALEMRWEGAVGRRVFEPIVSTNSIQQLLIDTIWIYLEGTLP